jgi:predicted nuclease of predicted toxin-antitoxin system
MWVLLAYQKSPIASFGITPRQTASRLYHDADFAEMAALLGAPPKVVWLRTGNQSTTAIVALLRRHAKLIAAFAGDGDAACLEIY